MKTVLNIVGILINSCILMLVILPPLLGRNQGQQG